MILETVYKYFNLYAQIFYIGHLQDAPKAKKTQKRVYSIQYTAI